MRSEENYDWHNVIQFQPMEDSNAHKPTRKSQNLLYEKQSEEELEVAELKDRQERKKTGLLMGKLHDDMIFLDKIAKERFRNRFSKPFISLGLKCRNVWTISGASPQHPALQKNLLEVKEDRPPPKDIDKVRLEIDANFTRLLRFSKR